MSKVLYIKANAKPEGQSRMFQVSDAFVESYKKAHPGDEVVVLDLYREGIRFLSVEDVMMHATGTENPQDHPVLKYAFQFLNADKYIFAEPLWNLGIPAILKAYIDYITINTVTFKYTIDGPVGLCTNKKAINITGRGGEYSSGVTSGWELGDRYLKTILGFLGICDYQTLAIETLDVMGQDVGKLVGDAIGKANEIAKTF